LLNGISSEGISVLVETFFALLCGIILGFTFSWHLSLVCLGCVPFIWFSVVVNSKLQSSASKQVEEAYNEANLLA
jgi:ABC-type bacteriocin/lantibiotic exporter with double-glycine peptidase domain